MAGRDPHEPHRVATPLELLYDLVFVVAFSVASAQFAHAIAAGHWASGLGAFVFCLFGAVWAWINFSWFASAYDTDDWIYRLLAMVQMCGVALLALGVPDIFRSFEQGGVLHNEVLVAGYVVMRLALLAQFLRAAARDRSRRRVISTYVTGWGVAQIGWLLLLFLHVELPWAIWAALPLYVLELGTPWVAERKGGLPWHAHHIAERYSALTIISLGEVVVGTIGSLAVLVERGWNVDTVLLLVAGMGLALGLWWSYFLTPIGDALAARRGKATAFSLLHIPIYMSIAAVGAGLHVVAYLLDKQDADFAVLISPLGTVTALSAPMVVFVLLVFVLYADLFRTSWAHDAFHGGLLLVTLATAAAGVAVVALGGSVMAGVVVIACAPAILCTAFEVWGHRHLREELDKLDAVDEPDALDEPDEPEERAQPRA